MSDEVSGKSIVTSRQTNLMSPAAVGNRLIQRAASDALVPIQNMMDPMAPTLHQVGKREFHDEDFRQLQVWASELGMEGRLAELVNKLDDVFNLYSKAGTAGILLRRKLKDWHENGRIKYLRLFVGTKRVDSLNLPGLTHLHCTNGQLIEISIRSLTALE
jgi:hypothetical protein